MSEPAITLALAGFTLAGLALVVAALLKGWQGWLELRRTELATPVTRPQRSQAQDLIEVADLKERVRKLEAIAACVDI